MKKKLKSSRYQLGGPVENNPLVNPTASVDLNLDSLVTRQKYEASRDSLLKAANYDYEAIKEMARMVYGNKTGETSNKVKSKVQRYREHQTGGNINPLDPNNYGKKYVAPKSPASRYSLVVTDSNGSTKTAPGAREQYLSPKKVKGRSNDILTDVVYASQDLLDNTITEPLVKKALYESMKVSRGNSTVNFTEEGAIDPSNLNYTGGDKGKADLVSQFVYGDQKMAPAKYKPKQDYLEFLPTYSIKEANKNYGNIFDTFVKKTAVDLGHFNSQDAIKEIKDKIAKKENIYASVSDPIENITFGYDLGNYKMGIGYDEKTSQPYVSVADAWDFDPEHYAEN